MYPVLLRLGPLSFYSYGMFVLLALATGFIVMALMAHRLSMSVGLMLLGGTLASGALVFGAKVGFVLVNLSKYAGDPIRGLVIGGFALTPGLLLAIVVTLGFALIARQSVGGTFDVMSASLLAALSVGRVGCFLAGCCFGRATTLPWGLRFPPHGLIPPELEGKPLHPTQLYLSISFAALAVALAVLSRRRVFPGQLALAALAGYSVVALVVGPLRFEIGTSVIATAFWLVAGGAALALVFLLRPATR